MILINLVIINTEVRLRIFEFVSRFSIILSSCFIMFITVAAIYESILTNFVIESKNFKYDTNYDLCNLWYCYLFLQYNYDEIR